VKIISLRIEHILRERHECNRILKYNIDIFMYGSITTCSHDPDKQTKHICVILLCIIIYLTSFQYTMGFHPKCYSGT
jgi:hypothetical protein